MKIRLGEAGRRYGERAARSALSAARLKVTITGGSSTSSDAFRSCGICIKRRTEPNDANVLRVERDTRVGVVFLLGLDSSRERKDRKAGILDGVRRG